MKYKFRALLFGAALVTVSDVASAQSHFSQCASGTGSNASVIIDPAISPKIDGSSLASGDEIAVYTAAGLCAGADVWTGSVIAVTVWADDPFTPTVDGMAANESLRFVMWDKSSGTEVGLSAGSSVSASFDSAPPYRGTGTFVADAIYRLTSLNGQSANAAPIASVTATPTSGTTPVLVSFNGSASSDSDGSIASYAWSFGDGTSGTGATVQHTYTQAGSYTASLTVTDNDGATGSKTVSITATDSQNQPPVASFVATPTTGTAPLLVSVNANQSSDSDGTIASYAWVYGDGTSGSGKNAAHTYPSPGTYTLQLTVTDDDGATASQTATITVVEGANQQPIANFTASPTSGTAPVLVAVDASGSSDPDGSIASYAWSYGDATNGTGRTANHTYVTPGTYSLRLTVTDDDGGVNTITKTITVTGAGNQAPVARFVASPTNGNAPLLVNLNASQSSDPDGSIVTYAWDYGDGITGTGNNAAHTYVEQGTFTLTLTVTDNNGSIATASQTITVNNEANASPTAAFTATPESGNAPLFVSFDSGASSDSDGTIQSRSWSYGDGSNGSGMTPARTYNSPGNYTVTLTVTDEDGGIGTSQKLIQVLSDIGNQQDMVLRLTVDSASGSTLSDDSGKGQQASLRNGATFDASGGVEGGAVRLDGIDDYVDVADDASLNLGNITKRTISVWFKVDDRFIADRKQVVYEQGGNTRGLSIYVHNGTLYAGAWNLPTSESNWTGTFLQTGSIQSGQWHHVALVLDGQSTTLSDGKLRAYLDGALFGSGRGAQIWGHQDDIGIGAVDENAKFHDGAVSGTKHAFAGLIDEIRVYQAVLSESDIQALASFSGQAPNQAPTAQFVFNPSTAQAPANITLDASGSADPDGSIVNYSWDFGDATTGSGRTVTHRFDGAGTYSLSLTVTDDDGARSSASSSIVVTAASGNSAPVPSFTAAPVPSAPRSIRFDASASSDPDGVVDQFIWDFGDGNAKVGEVVTHDYENGGVYVVKLTIVDNGGSTAISEKTVEVETALPSSLQPSTIGPLRSNGNVSFTNQQWQLTVPGHAWDPRLDAMLFVHRPVNNDVLVTVRVDSISVEDSLLYAGVGIRGGLSPTSANAAVNIIGDQVVFTYRAADDGWEIQSASADITLPQWLRVGRKNDKVVGAYSSDGIIWTDLADQTLPIETGIYGGLVAHSSDPNRIASAMMSEFAVAVDDDVLIDVPNDYVLSQNFPNPFVESTQLSLTLSRQEDILIEAYDLAGRRVTVLQNGPMAPNTVHRIVFHGSRLSSGLYLIRVVGDSFVTTRKVTLVR